ncbi:hypothetical protein SBC1_15930 [Caballeronia sp. SBC1]|uniref:hypothetical protein n=1 Tax=Caballeronia sp. SBC1 TaxID=2705548 RepID=UPI001408133A|nr:hypothetical protein [Caballeronia sp. SBC1]QIN61599.1 hypothetical protein SBC1_15930 [Caballeronia sp. SBC1]
MNQPQPDRTSNTQRFFINPRAFVLSIEIEPGQHQLVTEGDDQHHGLLCFLSPMDAHIEGTFRARPGLSYSVLSTWSLSEKSFLADNGLLVAVLHLGWSARNGRLLLRQDGIPRQYGGPLLTWAGKDRPITFEVSATALCTLDRIYEHAGLFAWRETCESLLKEASEDLRTTAIQAVLAARTMTPKGDDPATQTALFDPEFQQWHFLPVAITDDQPIND